jgi:hypothetical protein
MSDDGLTVRAQYRSRERAGLVSTTRVKRVGRCQTVIARQREPGRCIMLRDNRLLGARVIDPPADAVGTDKTHSRRRWY